MLLEDFQKRGLRLLEDCLRDDFPLVEAKAEAKAELVTLLCHVLGKTSGFIFAFPEYRLTDAELENLERVLARRQGGEPLAYILNRKEFWSMPLYVDNNVLIPRADTESIVEHALRLPLPENARVIDLGTGSGAIAIALCREQKKWQVLACDLSFDALKVAQKNIIDYCEAPNVPALVCASWMSASPGNCFDLVVANPPYIDRSDPAIAGHTKAEPEQALFSDNNGMKDIACLLEQALRCLKPGGWVLLEHGFQQHDAVTALAAQLDFEGKVYSSLQTVSDCSGKSRGFAAQVVSA